MNLADVHVPFPRSTSDPRADSAPLLDDVSIKRNKKIARAWMLRDPPTLPVETSSNPMFPPHLYFAVDKDKKRLCRYIPKVEDAVRQLIGDTLSEEAFPWVKAPPVKGSLAAVEAVPLTSTQMRAAHGEVVNKFVAAAQAVGAGVDFSKVKSGATKKSKFGRADDAGSAAGSGGNASSGASGGAGGGGAGAATGGAAAGAGTDEPDIFSKLMEPQKARTYDGGRIIVFFVGGVSQSELAVVERISKEMNREIIVGGTSVLSSRDSLEQLERTNPEDEDVGGGGARGPAKGAKNSAADVDMVDLDAMLNDTF